jgi:hypothetical protein
MAKTTAGTAGTNQAELARLRAALVGMTEQLQALDVQLLPREEWQARVSDWLARQAARFEDIALFHLRAGRSPIPGPASTLDLFSQMVGPAPGGRNFAEVDLNQMLIWLHGPALKARLAELIAAEPYDEGPPLADRPALKERLEAEIRETEIREELLIRAAEAQGVPDLQRRPDARPDIVLAWQDTLETRNFNYDLQPT